MYNTVKEMHIAIDMELQHINSNRKQSITPYHKDMALNQAVLQFVDTRTNPTTNVKKEGLEDTQKRYDDIRELRDSAKLDVLIDKDEVFGLLPYNYYKLVSAGARVKYFKSNKPAPKLTKRFNYYVVNVADDTSGKYSTPTFINSITNQTVVDFSKANFSTFHSADAKFMLINEVLNSNNNNVYWESWDKSYHNNSFIIVDPNLPTMYEFKYSNIVNVSMFDYVTYMAYSSEVGDNRVPVDLISGKHEFEVSGNHYHDQGRHLNPSAIIKNNRFVIQENDNFLTTLIIINYIKRPRLINHRTGQMCEIHVNREIVSMAVQRLKAYIKDEGYQHIVSENQIIE